MTQQQADTILAKTRRVDLFSEHLVGYERISADIPPEDTVGRIAIAKMVQDCDGTYGQRKVPHLLAECPNGRISFWTLPPELEPR